MAGGWTRGDGAFPSKTKIVRLLLLGTVLAVLAVALLAPFGFSARAIVVMAQGVGNHFSCVRLADDISQAEPMTLLDQGRALDASFSARPYEQRYYYRQLPAREQQWYRSLWEALRMRQLSALLVGPYDDAMQDVTWAVRSDNPEFFYAEGEGVFVRHGLVTEYRIDATIDDQEVREREACIAQAASGALKGAQGLSERDGALFAASWVFEHLDYDYEGSRLMDSASETEELNLGSNTLYGAMAEGVALCGGYSKAYAYLCNLLGVECLYVEGYACTEDVEGMHAWNMVRIGDSWSVVDTTWCEAELNAGVPMEDLMVSDAWHNRYITSIESPVRLPEAT